MFFGIVSRIGLLERTPRQRTNSYGHADAALPPLEPSARATGSRALRASGSPANASNNRSRPPEGQPLTVSSCWGLQTGLMLTPAHRLATRGGERTWNQEPLSGRCRCGSPLEKSQKPGQPQLTREAYGTRQRQVARRRTERAAGIPHATLRYRTTTSLTQWTGTPCRSDYVEERNRQESPEGATHAHVQSPDVSGAVSQLHVMGARLRVRQVRQ